MGGRVAAGEAGKAWGREDRGEGAGVLADGAMADGVDARVKDVEAAGGHPVVDGRGGYRVEEELGAGDDPERALGEAGDQRVDRPRSAKT